MASLKRQTVLELSRGARAFLNLELGVTRGPVPILSEQQGKSGQARKPREVLRRDAFIGALKNLETGRLLDLGCGKGEFALAARDLGWSVTAVESRPELMPPAPRIDWVHSDARKFVVGEYECIRLFGVLYELGLGEQLDLLQRCSGSPTIVESRAESRPTHEERGYEGWMVEGAFRPTEKALIRMVRDSGFSSVSKLEHPHVPDRSFYLCT